MSGAKKLCIRIVCTRALVVDRLFIVPVLSLSSLAFSLSARSESRAERRWTVHLDRDLLRFLLSVYPHWFEVIQVTGDRNSPRKVHECFSNR